MENRLITVVKKNPVLFDKWHRLHKDAATKADIWHAVEGRVSLTYHVEIKISAVNLQTWRARSSSGMQVTALLTGASQTQGTYQ